MLDRKDWRPLVWAVVGLMALAMMVSFMGWDRGSWSGDGGYGMMGGWMWVPFLLAMLAMMFVMMSMGGHHHGHGHGPPHGQGEAHGDARAILDRRYAAGELSREEYQRMREDLERRP